MDMFRTFSIQAVTVSEAPASPQVSPVQQTAVIPSGISSLPDTLESPVSSYNFSPNLFGGSTDVFSPMDPLLPLEDIPADSAGGVESSLFDKSRFWKADGSALEGAKIHWDIIEALKTFQMNEEGHPNDLINSLMSLSNEDFALTLKTLAESGNPSDLSKIMAKINYFGHGFRTSDLLAKLGRSLPAEGLQETFRQVLSSVYHPILMIDFLTKVQGEGVLPHLNRDNITQIYDMLLDPPTVSGSLYLTIVGQESGLEPHHDPDVIWGIPSPESLLANYVTNESIDYDIARALTAFPDRAISMLKSMQSTDPNFIRTLIDKMLSHGADIGPFLAELVKRPAADSVLTEILRSMTGTEVVFNQHVSRSTLTDHQLLSMISSLGDNAVNILSQLSPLRLIEMKAILEVDNTPENQAAIKNVIEPALEKAKG